MAEKKKSTSKKNESSNKKTSIFKKVWFWLIIGLVLIAGAGGTTYAMTRPSFEKIYNKYSEKMEDATPDLIKEFEERADKNKDGAKGLDEIYYDISYVELNKIYNEGKTEMDALKIKKDSKEDKKQYKLWSEQLLTSYSNQTSKIFKEVEKHPDYKNFTADDVLSEMETVVADVNSGFRDQTGEDAIISFEVNEDNPDEIKFTLNKKFGELDDDDLEESLEILNEGLTSGVYLVTNEPHFTYTIDGDDKIIAESKEYPYEDEIELTR